MKTEHLYRQAALRTGHILDAWIPAKMRYSDVPGVSIGIVFRGKLVYKRGFGYADKETDVPATPKTLYRIASVSKIFTAVALLQLAEARKLCLDDPIARFVPWFCAGSAKRDSRYITIRQALSHSSGLFRDGTTPHWETGEFPSSLRDAFSERALVFETLSRFKYSNYAFSLLGEVIFRVSGVPYEAYVRRNILDPLGMTCTYPDVLDSVGSVATGYSRKFPDEDQRPFPHVPARAYAPATGFVSNVPDLAVFLSVFAKDAKEHVLSRESKKIMGYPFQKVSDDEAYGLGLSVYCEEGRTRKGHSGTFLGFSSCVEQDDANDIGVIVLANSELGIAEPLNDSIFSFIYHFVDYADRYDGKGTDMSPYEGVYRGRSSDELVAAAESALISFPVDARNPIRSMRRLVPVHTRHHFHIEEDDGVDVPGEEAVFSEFAGGRPHRVRFGATPAKRHTYEGGIARNQEP